MSRGPATFRKRDLIAALKAAHAAGCDKVRVEIQPGKMVLETSQGGAGRSHAADVENEWDDAK
ncbi:MAG: hypothetical protein ACYCZX_14575 [Rhodospirillaceae bacterium]